MLPRILIVDDSPMIRKLVRACVEAQPDWMVCGEAGNGQEAILLGQQCHPNLIIMDLSMPVMNGLEAAQIFHKLMPSVPLIMFTSFSTSNLKRQAIEAGYSEIILKTQSLDELISSVRTLVADAA
jgi:DNA-binding NarL/FixJ family response regulator